MNVRKADEFIADVERQFEWYAANAGWELAERYLSAVEATCRLLGQHPLLGPRGGFTPTHACVTGDSSSCFDRLGSMSCFTKLLVLHWYCGGRCMDIATCQGACWNRPALSSWTITPLKRIIASRRDCAGVILVFSLTEAGGFAGCVS